MEKAKIVFSILTHSYDFMLWFWMFVTLPVALWHLFYFPSKSQLNEKALAEISPEFKSINSEYVIFSVFAICLLIGFPFMALTPSWNKWSMMKYGIEFYPSGTIFG